MVVLCTDAKIYSHMVSPRLTLGQKISTEFCKTIATSGLREVSTAVFFCIQMILHKSHA